MIDKILIVFCLIGLCCCNHQLEVEEAPENLISEDKMVLLIADLQLVESHGLIPRVNQPYHRDSLDHYFQEVFNNHDVTVKQYFQSLKYYSDEPEKMYELYNGAIDHINKELTAYEEVEIETTSLNAISRQMVADIIIQTPYSEKFLNDSSLNTITYLDSISTYLDEDTTGILKEKGTNLSSFQYSYNVNTVSEMMLDQLLVDLKNKKDKLSGKD